MYVVSALYEREESAKGQFIDVSKHEVMASRSDYVLAQFVAGEMNVREGRDAYDLFGPAGIFPCKDGFIYVWMATVQNWQAYQELLGNPQWAKEFPERWLELELTPERVAKVRHHLCEWLQTKGKDEAAEEAQKLGLTLVAVNYPKDIVRSPQYIHRGYFAEVTHPVLGRALYPTVPYKLSETPARISSPAPLLGQHTAQRLAATDGGDGE